MTKSTVSISTIQILTNKTQRKIFPIFSTLTMLTLLSSNDVHAYHQSKRPREPKSTTVIFHDHTVVQSIRRIAQRQQRACSPSPYYNNRKVGKRSLRCPRSFEEEVEISEVEKSALDLTSVRIQRRENVNYLR
jgi:hypothetical protein